MRLENELPVKEPELPFLEANAKIWSTLRTK